MQPHDCSRCGARLDPPPESTYAVVDVLDESGEYAVLLCRDCGRELRGFLSVDEE
jgi:DNA-directed RNA polymerase subunit RPC12/RpoP